jgi:hypothetical protein
MNQQDDQQPPQQIPASPSPSQQSTPSLVSPNGTPPLPSKPKRDSTTTKKARIGRPSKLTAEGRKKILQALASGAPVRVAAEWVGITEAALWVIRGRDKAFDKSIRQQVAATIIKACATGNQDPRWPFWYLERVVPEFREKVEVAGNANAGPPQVNVTVAFPRLGPLGPGTRNAGAEGAFRSAALATRKALPRGE